MHTRSRLASLTLAVQQAVDKRRWYEAFSQGATTKSLSSSATWHVTVVVVCCSTTVPTSSRHSQASSTRSQRTLRAELCDLLRVILQMKRIHIHPIRTVILSSKSVRIEKVQIKQVQSDDICPSWASCCQQSLFR